jgi:hypothetical protein
MKIEFFESFGPGTLGRYGVLHGVPLSMKSGWLYPREEIPGAMAIMFPDSPDPSKYVAFRPCENDCETGK